MAENEWGCWDEDVDGVGDGSEEGGVAMMVVIKLPEVEGSDLGLLTGSRGGLDWRRYSLSRGPEGEWR